jgi:hypothetical protein
MMRAAMKRRPPSMKTYQEARFNLGKARSRAPIMMGMRKLPSTAGMAATRKKKIMMIPWALNILL